MSYKKSVIVSILELALFALTAKAADAINYLDESGNTRSVPVGSYTLVTDATTTLGDGWYVVAYPDVVRGGMTVSGNARLILCDGMSLTVQGDYHQPGITVQPGASLSVYGQVAGTGVLRATGGASGAGIGGGDWGACGTVTINGGRVTAQGGDYGAGIGGGYGGAGGTVSINGGAISAKGGIYSADIGGGFSGAAGTVSISGGIFAQEPDSKWMVSGFSVRANTDEATRVLYPWTVTPGYGVTVGNMTDVSAAWTIEGAGVTNVIAASSFRVPSDATVTIVFRPKPARRFADGSASKSVTVTVTGDLDISFRVPQTVSSPVEYLDENGNTRSLSAGAYTLVTAATTTLGDGWYVVADPDVVRGGMTVSGSARLILFDGMSLTVQGDYHKAGVAVPSGASLSVYGQVAGTGVLRATGGASAAGIGGGDRSACGTVTINGGAVSATGGMPGADIGGGLSGAAGTVSISGGIFARIPDPAWLAEGVAVLANPDETTGTAYPWMVVPLVTKPTLRANGGTIVFADAANWENGILPTEGSDIVIAVTAETRIIITNSLSLGVITIDGSATPLLRLMEGAKLSIQNTEAPFNCRVNLASVGAEVSISETLKWSNVVSAVFPGNVKYYLNDGVKTYRLNTAVSPGGSSIVAGETAEDAMEKVEITIADYAAKAAGQAAVVKKVAVPDKTYGAGYWKISLEIDEEKMPEGKKLADSVAAFVSSKTGMTALAGATEAKTITIPSASLTSGLYYSLLVSPNVNLAVPTETARALATEKGDLSLTVEPAADTKAPRFFKIKASLQKESF